MDELAIQRAVLMARAAHEVNRIYCYYLGEVVQQPWDDATPWQRQSCVKGVHGVLAGNTPEQSHASWLAEKQRTGWVYGLVKDPEAKTHPCMVSYDQLTPEQRAKDALFVAVVRAVAAALATAYAP